MNVFGARAISLRTNPVLVLAAALPLCGAVAGVAMAADARLGVAIVLGALFLPVVLTNLQLALALWLPVIFLEGLPAFNAAAKLGGLLIAGAWLAAAIGSRFAITDVLRPHRVLLLALAAILLWSSLSLLWAVDTGLVLEDLWRWYAVAVLVLVVATVATTPKGVRMICAAFVAGATLSVAHGVVTGGGALLSQSALEVTTFETVAASEGRLVGGQGDPNFLAAGVVAAIVIGAVLLATTQDRRAKWAYGGAVALLVLGLAASQSRGGLIAAVFITVAALVVFKRQRSWTIAAVTVAAGLVAGWFAISPTAWERITNYDAGGSGRTELWTLGLRMFEDKPITGAGLYNYHAAAPEYTDESGSLGRVDLLFTHDRQEAHNLYLSALGDIGAVGLLLLLTIALTSMRAMWLAARRSEAVGDRALELLARGVLVATIGFLAASFFLSNSDDKRLWILFALGPALYAAAHRSPRQDIDEGAA